jgi:hypothetical protein
MRFNATLVVDTSATAMTVPTNADTSADHADSFRLSSKDTRYAPWSDAVILDQVKLPFDPSKAEEMTDTDGTPRKTDR